MEVEYKVIEYYVREFYDVDDEIPPKVIITDNWERGSHIPYDSEIEIERVKYYD